MILKDTGEKDMNYKKDSHFISFSGDILKWRIEIVDDRFPDSKIYAWQMTLAKQNERL